MKKPTTRAIGFMGLAGLIGGSSLAFVLAGLWQVPVFIYGMFAFTLALAWCVIAILSES